MRRHPLRSREKAKMSRRPYGKPLVQKVKIRTANQQLARVDAINHCTAHLHDDATKSPCKF